MSRQRILFLVIVTVTQVLASLPAIAQEQTPATKLGRREIAAQAFGLEALRLTYAPGESSVYHVHEAVRLVVVLRGGRLTSISKEGIETTVELVTGTATILPPTGHIVRNDDDTTIELIELEIPADRPRESTPQRRE